MSTAISVIVTVYKVELWLPYCIDSILLQDFTDFECILVNDGSPDNCPRICDEYAKKDSRIIVIHQKNGGVTSARKVGIEKSSGEYVCFVDGDDTVPPDALTLLFDRAKLYDLDILITAKNKITGNKSYIYKNKISGMVSQKEYIEASLLGQCAIGLSGGLTKKAFLTSDIFDISHEITNNEDLVANLRLGLCAQKIGIYNDIVTYNYITRKGSASSQPMKYETWLKLFDYCGDVIEKMPDNIQSKNVLIRFKLRRLKKLIKSEKFIYNEMTAIALIADKIEDMKPKEKEIIDIILHYKYRFFINLYYIPFKIFNKIYLMCKNK
jgi:glycosyltransferase involved in cell wall biosynthesis